MNKQLDTKTIEFNILQPILTIFIIFFILVTFTIIYLESLSFQDNSNKVLIYVLVILTFTSALFYITKYYIKQFSSTIKDIHSTNIQKIQFSKKYLKALEDTSPNLLISAIGSNIESVNKAFLEFTEYKDLSFFHSEHTCVSELFIQKKGYLSGQINGEHWFSYVLSHPNILHKAIMKKNNKEYIFIVESRELNIDNINRSITTLVDITEFENLQTRFKLAINGTQDGLWDWDLVNNEVYFSAQWKKQLGYEEKELKNELKTWEERVHPDDLEQALSDIQANVDKKTSIYENIHRLQHKDGSWVWILDRGQTVYNEKNEAVRMVGFHTDITDKKSIEQELQDKDEMMIAQSRNAAMGEMISMIAHQWRQPLSIISMGANNIKADIELETIDENILSDISSEIIMQTNELSKTIDDFREFFKPKKEQELVSVHDIFDDTFNIIGKSLENNGIKLIKSLNSNKKIKTYSRELMQVFLNILKNAKEVLVDNNIEEKFISIKTTDNIDSVIIEISDNGGGIPNWVMPKVFDPYFTTKDDKTGTGLGLYMCKTIIEKHLNGNILATNIDNGACFKIIIKDKNNE